MGPLFSIPDKNETAQLTHEQTAKATHPLTNWLFLLCLYIFD